MDVKSIGGYLKKMWPSNFSMTPQIPNKLIKKYDNEDYVNLKPPMPKMYQNINSRLPKILPGKNNQLIKKFDPQSYGIPEKPIPKQYNHHDPSKYEIDAEGYVIPRQFNHYNPEDEPIPIQYNHYKPEEEPIPKQYNHYKPEEEEAPKNTLGNIKKEIVRDVSDDILINMPQAIEKFEESYNAYDNVAVDEIDQLTTNLNNLHLSDQPIDIFSIESLKDVTRAAYLTTKQMVKGVAKGMLINAAFTAGVPYAVEALTTYAGLPPGIGAGIESISQAAHMTYAYYGLNSMLGSIGNTGNPIITALQVGGTLLSAQYFAGLEKSYGSQIYSERVNELMRLQENANKFSTPVDPHDMETLNLQSQAAWTNNLQGLSEKQIEAIKKTASEYATSGYKTDLERMKIQMYPSQEMIEKGLAIEDYAPHDIYTTLDTLGFANDPNTRTIKSIADLYTTQENPFTYQMKEIEKYATQGIKDALANSGASPEEINKVVNDIATNEIIRYCIDMIYAAPKVLSEDGKIAKDNGLILKSIFNTQHKISVEKTEELAFIIDAIRKTGMGHKIKFESEDFQSTIESLIKGKL